MNSEKRLKDYKENIKIIPKEQLIAETVRKSIETYCSAEQEQ